MGGLEEKRFFDALKDIAIRYKAYEEIEGDNWVRVLKAAVEGRYMEMGGSSRWWTRIKGLVLARYKNYIKEDRRYFYIRKELIEHWLKEYEEMQKAAEEEANKILKEAME